MLDISDTGAGKLFVQLHNQKLRWHKHRRIWLTWDDNIWQEDSGQIAWLLAEETANKAKELASQMPVMHIADESDELAALKAKAVNRNRKAALQWAEFLRSRAGTTSMLDMAKPRLNVGTPELDCNPWILVCDNGTLDLKTLQLRSSRPDDLSTRKVNCPWLGDQLTSPEWESFLAEITGGDHDLAAYLQRSFGYCLLGEWREKAFWFAYGTPDGGKSTLLTVMARIFGSYHMAADSSTWMQHQGGNRGDLVRLAGARLVTTSEVEAEAKFSTSLMKKITGGDPIVAAAKYEGEISYEPQFGLWLAGNDRPKISTNDEGLWRRVRCVPFTNSVPKERQDPTLPARLVRDSGPAILAWVARGLADYLQNGLGSCKAIEQANADYRAEMNPLTDFVSDCLRIDSSLTTPVAAVQARYESWCDENGVRAPLHPRAFKKALMGFGPLPHRTKDVRMWLYVGLKPICR